MTAKKVIKLGKSDVLALNVKLISVSSNRKLLYVKDTASNGYYYCMNIYEYNNKLTLLSNLVTATRNAGKSKNKQLSSWARGDLPHVKPNALTVRWCDSTDATGFYYQDITYKIPCNKISNSNPIYTLIGPDKSNPIEWTATRSFSVTQGMGNVYISV